MSKKVEREAEKIEAVKRLRKMLRPGQTVYCVLRHVSASGMTRRIDFYAIKGKEHVYLSGYMATALGMRRHASKDGLIVEGCGMDMGFAVVYDLSRTLYPKGFVPAKAKMRGRNGTPDTEIDTDGGYALRHSWM